MHLLLKVFAKAEFLYNRFELYAKYCGYQRETEPINVKDKPSGAKIEVCLFKQKTRLARIRATKIRGTNAYMRYKQNGLLIDSLEEVTGAKRPGPR